ncbi:chromosomal replication initiator protein DnaA [Candidatus Mycoplasma pogonae]
MEIKRLNEKMQELTNVFLQEIKVYLNDELLFKTVVDNQIQIEKIENEIVYFRVPNRDIKEWMEIALLDKIKEFVHSKWPEYGIKIVDSDLLEKLNSTSKKSLKKISSDLENDEISLDNFSNQKEMKSYNQKEKQQELLDIKKNDKNLTNLMDYFTFEKLAKVNYNKNVLSAVKEIIESKEVIYSPLFIFSASGLGKTHILNATGLELLKKNKKVRYVDANTFTTKIAFDLQNKNSSAINDLVEELSDIDVLIFDDVQNYANKHATLNVLFNIINNHILRKKQIILAADRTVDQLGGFEERFITRFSAGLTLELPKPNDEDLIKVWKFKLNQEGLKTSNWDKDSYKFIARNYHGSIRFLEGAMNTIKFYSKRNPDIKYTYSVIQSIFGTSKQTNENLTPEKIIKTVADYYKLKISDILSNSRKKEIWIARSVAIYIIRKQLGMKYKQIGANFGNKDHTTIMNSINKIETMQKDGDHQIKNAIIKIEENMKKLS